jgi:hypothetical protein
MKEPRMSENGEIGVMQITCFDGTVLQFPDDDRLGEYLGGVSVNEIFQDSSKIPAASERYITFRPPPPPRKIWIKDKFSKIWKALKD